MSRCRRCNAPVAEWDTCPWCGTAHFPGDFLGVMSVTVLVVLVAVALAVAATLTR